MNEQHLNERELQEFAVGTGVKDLRITMHVEACAHCAAQVAIYRLIAFEVSAAPPPAFQPDFANLVMQQIAAPRGTSLSSVWSRALLPAIILLAIIIFAVLYGDLIVSFLSVTKNTSIMVICVSGLLILLFQGSEMFRKYRKMMQMINQ